MSAETSSSIRYAFLYGLGAAGLGVVGLVFGDFALQWQPVPEGLPGYRPLAYLVALLLLLAGVLILIRKRPKAGAWTVAAIHGLNVVFLQTPKVAAAPLTFAWLGFAEFLALCVAGVMLALALDHRRHAGALRSLQLLFGCCPVVWGLSHFGYPDFTASMIPEWLPGRLFLAYATGVFHIAAGVAIAAGALIPGANMARLARLAAVMLTVMLGLFVLLVHVTGVIGDPASRQQWTMLFVATSLAGAACIVATPRKT